ncbi:MAG: hypothetical protein RBR14_01545 [Candidatus Cloacimonas acidaminovorans]|nr:hypothetical protein [Candidatus Cloacimonas acidaminovorans]
MGQKILYSPEQMDVSKGIYPFSIYLIQNLHSRKLQQKKYILRNYRSPGKILLCSF